MEELAEAALAAGFVSLGFSDHSYTPFDLSCCMTPERERASRKKFQILRERYRGKLDLFYGIELDADSAPPNEPVEYVIASVHNLRRGGAWYILDLSAEEQRRLADDHFGGSMTDLAKAYFERVTEFVLRKKPDIVGHFDLITKFSQIPEEDPAYRDAALEAIRAIVPLCPRFELNTGAIARGRRTVPYPADFMLREILRLGGKIILGTDCHDKTKLTVWYDEGLRYLRSLGFSVVSRLTPNGFVEDALPSSPAPTIF